MEQMRRYGIPASVTLAQGIIESANGQSTLAQTANNHFGVKGTYNGQYVLANDDKQNEKFKKYDSVAQSYEDHSKVLMSSRYTQYTNSLAHDDYKGWAAAIKKGGYATASNYESTIIGVVEGCDLQKYDKMVMEQMKREGKTFGTAGNPLSAKGNSSSESSQKPTGMELPEGKYSMPILRSETLLITSSYGKRTDPMDHSKTQVHHGIDLRAKGNDILATENNGKVIVSCNNVNTGGGKAVTVEYTRDDGSKTRVQYMHLSKVDVKVGDTVNAGQKLGVTGNTGTRTTGEHLHFGVINVDREGKQQWVNPAAYLAEINQKGNLGQKVFLKNGTDALAQYSVSNSISDGKSAATQKEQTPDNWLKMLMASEGTEGGISEGGGILDTIMHLFMSLMMVAMTMENKSREEKMEAITDAVLNKKIDITSMVPGMKSVTLSVKGAGDGSVAVLNTDDGKNDYNTQLSEQQTRQLSSVINSDLDNAAKQQRIASFVTSVSMSQQASQNFEQIASQQQAQQQLQRK